MQFCLCTEFGFDNFTLVMVKIVMDQVLICTYFSEGKIDGILHSSLSRTVQRIHQIGLKEILVIHNLFYT